MGDLEPFGDSAVRFAIGEATPRRRLLGRLEAIAGVADVVLAETVGAVVFDDGSDRRALESQVAQALDEVVASNASDAPAARHVIPVVYDGADLDDVARALGRDPESVALLHASGEYTVSMLGFMPGFAYMRGLPEELVLPRRAPRPRVPRGSVAIAAQYTGIYPSASPGGWHLLGRAPGFEPFGPERATFALGDAVTFSAVSAADAPALSPSALSPSALAASAGAAVPEGPYLEVARIAGIALRVDGGRRGHMHQGVPRGGPLVRSMLARANALVDNPPAACALELVGTLEVVARGGDAVVSDGERSARLSPGDTFTLSTGGRSRVVYLAIAGGLDAPLVLGGRGALLALGIGPPLRRGDRLFPQSRSPDASGEVASAERPEAGPIRVRPGPDAIDGFSLDRIAELTFRISAASDRTGTRLEGWTPPPLGAREAARPSAPMVPGAIELTPSGLIVLGPDHPTTGGYPVVAVVRATSLDSLFSLPIGGSVRLAVG